MSEPITPSDDVLGGVAVFYGTRVPVKTLVDYLAAGDTIDDFLADFPTVKREQAVQFLELNERHILESAHSMDDISFLNLEFARLEKLFAHFNHQMVFALQKASDNYNSHMVSRGNVLENAVREYLAETIGQRYSVTGNGFIFDINGKVSLEQDVIIYDDFWSPRFVPRSSEDNPYLLADSCFATIEVKKKLSSQALKDSLEKVKSFKSLYRESISYEFVTPNAKAHIISNGYKRNWFFSAIFAFSVDRSIEAVLNQLKEVVAKENETVLPDLIFIKDKGIILPYCLTCDSSAPNIYMITQDKHEFAYHFDEFGQKYSLLSFHIMLLDNLSGMILKLPNFHEMYRQISKISRNIQATNKGHEKK